MATVTKRSKRQGAKWTAIYTDETGKQIWKLGFTDKAETLRMALKLEDECRQIRLGMIDPQTEARRVERAKPIQTHLDSFKSHMESKARTPLHVQYTIRDVERCIAFTGIENASALTLPQVDAWRSSCEKAGDSKKTINRRIASVKAFLRYLVTIEAVTRCVLEGYQQLNAKGHETFSRRALTKDESALLVEKCPDDHRREIYRFALLTGFRRSELKAMTPACFDFKNLTITISAKDAKNKKADASIPMAKDLIAPLKKLCEGKLPNVPVFHLLNKKYVVNKLRDDCDAAGVDTTEIDFHALRHTFCSQLAESGIRPELLRKLARHRDIATTMHYYVHSRPDDERAALNKLSA